MVAGAGFELRLLLFSDYPNIMKMAISRGFRTSY